MTAPGHLKHAFSQLMVEGLNITRQTQEGSGAYTEDVLHDVFNQYQIWQSKIKDFLADAGHDTLEWHQFYEGSSVPPLKGGEEYGSIQSQKSQELLKNIRIETSKKLDLLKTLGDTLFGKFSPVIKVTNDDVVEIKGDKQFFRFNTLTGGAVLNKTRVNFPPGQQKFNLLKTLISGNEYQASYKQVCAALNMRDGKTARRDIQQIVKEIKQDFQILPKKKNSNKDILVNVPRNGYRIVID